ncbi:hypothetical protein OHA40_25290 [Nocardia sp. NBC_00508]|nr:hypothetical protein [Nocardia sp. NBC_00508]WUD70210.1 hypothetical protein OHA40_25290 [Nocardia sp. NBC_00508]
MSAVAIVVGFVCCALIIRTLATREQARYSQPVVIELEGARR